jgi:hypothetical protein
MEAEMTTLRRVCSRTLLSAGRAVACNFSGLVTPDLKARPRRDLAAQLTSIAQPQPTTPAPPTAIPVSPTTPATSTTAPTLTPSQTTVPCDRAEFVSDVTYPDGTDLAPGAAFTKTWRLRNTGSCTWTSSYSLVFDHGDSMGAAASTQLTTGTVAPGQTVDVSVSLTAPAVAGTYRGYFRLRNTSGVVFGIGPQAQTAFWVEIEVVPATTTVTLSYIGAKAAQFVRMGACSACGTSATLPTISPPRRSTRSTSPGSRQVR